MIEQKDKSRRNSTNLDYFFIYNIIDEIIANACKEIVDLCVRIYLFDSDINFIEFYPKGLKLGQLKRILIEKIFNNKVINDLVVLNTSCPDGNFYYH